VFRRYLKAGEEIVGAPNGSERLRVDVRRYAIAGVVFERSSRMWADLVDGRARGKGRRPSERQVERAARRLGLADMSLRDATTRLEALAGRRPTLPATPAELMAQIRREMPPPEEDDAEV
jgi:hypothetical protein